MTLKILIMNLRKLLVAFCNNNIATKGMLLWK